MNLAFFGDFTTFSAAHLGRCLAAGHRVTVFIATRKSYDKRRRRERPLSLLAPRWSVGAQLRRSRIPLVVTEIPVPGVSLAARLAPLGGDVLVSVGFPGRIPEPVRALYPRGAINVHPALLPNHRGPHPVHAMVLDGTLAESAGITIHIVTDGFDEGPILAQADLQGAGDIPLERLDIDLSQSGARLLQATLADLDRHMLQARPQPAGTLRIGRISGRDLAIGPGTGDAELNTLIRLGVLRFYPGIRHGNETIRIIGPVRRIGPATGHPPRVGLLFVEFDTRESRIHAPRARKPRKLWQKWRRILRLVATRAS